MQKKVIVEMLVDVDRPDDNSILEDLKQELNCASHSIEIVNYKEAFLVDSSEAAPPAVECSKYGGIITQSDHNSCVRNYCLCYGARKKDKI